MILSLFHATRVITGVGALEIGTKVTPWLAQATVQTHRLGDDFSVRLAETAPQVGDLLVTVGSDAALLVAEPCLRLAHLLLGAPA